MISAFDRLELGDWIRSLPKGLETNVGQRGSSLSAGERQLIALARAALTNPDVLVLDEATSAVDALTEVQLARALNAISAGRTTVSIAHRLSTASRADRILVLENGVIVEDGSHLELMTKQGNYFALYQQWLASSNSQMNL